MTHDVSWSVGVIMDVKVVEIKTKASVFDVYSMYKDREDVILLESSKDKDGLGKYSFIGLNPFKKITYKNGIVTVDGQIKSEDPFKLLNRVIASYALTNTTKLPFIGGCMGYFAYDLVRDMEKIPEINSDVVDIPTLYFVFYDNVIVFDHHHNKVYLTELIRMQSGNEQMQQIIEDIEHCTPVAYGATKKTQHNFISTFDRNSYMNTVEQMRSYIKAGDIYIANMTHMFLADTKRQSYDIYKMLRKLNPAPFSAYLNLDGFEVMCSSPERFIKVRNGKVETRPIKGTRPRGATPEEDEAMRHALEQSEKDRSELLMIVDLERNDLSKVCRPYTVKVTELFNIESYATVHHLVSTVVGELRREQTSVDLLKACFPGGSITGTPKIRAMEIIEELEHQKRNLYTGCIGYFGFDGACDFNIVIRTIIQQDNQLSIGVGGGITWESEAGSEYQETLDKAKALFKAVNTVEVSEEISL